MTIKRTTLAILTFALAVISTVIAAEEPGNKITPEIKPQQDAALEEYDWGTFHRYYQQGETYGTKGVVVGVAVIKPGYETHPPHQHVEEEFLMVTEGQGTMYLKGQAVATKKGDLLYTSPWDLHGIKNTGTEPLTFVVFKWNNKGVALPAEPVQEKK